MYLHTYNFIHSNNNQKVRKNDRKNKSMIAEKQKTISEKDDETLFMQKMNETIYITHYDDNRHTGVLQHLLMEVFYRHKLHPMTLTFVS